MKYLDPKNDLTFKKVFGQHPHLLQSFLNAILPLPDSTYIESLEYLPSDMVPETPLMKYSIVDVRCKDNQGRQFIVEMQMQWTTSFLQRVLFNASKAYVKQLDKAKDYTKLQPVYAINLVNENFKHDKEDYYHHYQIVNIADTEEQIEGLEFVFIELQKFKAKNVSEKKLQVLWLRFLTEIDENITEAPAELLASKEINEALENLQTSAFTNAELETYDKYWDSVRIEKTIKLESYDVGRAEGEEIGIEKGIQLKSFKTAINCIKRGMTDLEISEISELSVDVIIKLRKLFGKYGNDVENHFDEI